jgi:hypothetical protein
LKGKPFIELTVVSPLQLEAELEMEDIMSLKDGLTKQEVSILPFLQHSFFPKTLACTS